MATQEAIRDVVLSFYERQIHHLCQWYLVHPSISFFSIFCLFSCSHSHTHYHICVATNNRGVRCPRWSEPNRDHFFQLDKEPDPNRPRALMASGEEGDSFQHFIDTALPKIAHSWDLAGEWPFLPFLPLPSLCTTTRTTTIPLPSHSLTFTSQTKNRSNTLPGNIHRGSSVRPMAVRRTIYSTTRIQ